MIEEQLISGWHLGLLFGIFLIAFFIGFELSRRYRKEVRHERNN